MIIAHYLKNIHYRTFIFNMLIVLGKNASLDFFTFARSKVKVTLATFVNVLFCELCKQLPLNILKIIDNKA